MKRPAAVTRHGCERLFRYQGHWEREINEAEEGFGLWAVVSFGVRRKVANAIHMPGLRRTWQAVAASAKGKLR